MSSQRRVRLHADKAALTTSVAEQFLDTVSAVLATRDVAHVCLTGGSVGIGVLESINLTTERTIDWSRVHFWWGDERFVPRADGERNERQARTAFLNRIDVPEANIHAVHAADDGVTLDEAAEVYERQLAEYAAASDEWPEFDITFLGVGPDGHVASLFPDRPEVGVTDRAALPVRHSPKPPPERVTLTRGVLNSSKRVWFVLSGPDKASALGLGLAGASFHEVPVAGVTGTESTVFFADEAAAAEVPESLFIAATSGD